MTKYYKYFTYINKGIIFEAKLLSRILFYTINLKLTSNYYAGKVSFEVGLLRSFVLLILKTICMRRKSSWCIATEFRLDLFIGMSY